MNSDCYFEIGHSHTICQDYALTGKINDVLSYAIISDGCSSSPLVDVGARLLAHSAKEYLITRYSNHSGHPNVDPYELGLAVIVSAAKNSQMLSLPLEALDCTLIVTLLSEETTQTFFYGDGGLIMKDKDFSSYLEIEFESGAPFYLSYLLSPKREEAYKKQYGCKALIKHYRLEVDELLDRDIIAVENVNSGDFFRALTIINSCSLDFSVIMSDGVKTYQTHNEHGIAQPFSLSNALNQIIAYKGFKGQFVERRMKRMKKECEKDGITHYDDISVAAIYKGENNE